MKNYLLKLCVLLLFGQIIGQTKEPLQAGKPIQSKLEFSFPVSKVEAINRFKAEKKLDRNNIYLPTFSNTDESGKKHEHFQQYYKGLKVEYGVIITHSFENSVLMINGEVYNASQLDIAPTLNAEQALKVILDSKKDTKFLWESPEQASIMNYEKPSGELLVLPNVKTGEINLAYKFDIYSTLPIARDEIFVDAHTGLILYSNSIIKHAHDSVNKKCNNVSNNNKNAETDVSSKAEAIVSSETGTAETKYSGTRNIKTTLNASTNKYILLDDTRGNGIQTFDSGRTSSYSTTNFSDTDNNWTTAEHNNANQDNAALDAHWGAEMTYDFWKNVFNRNSYDGNGTILKNYVHYTDSPGTGMQNAFWNGSVMSYGDGGTTYTAFTSIDILAHEIGHGVCQATANLGQEGEASALNEGLSDVWGMCVKHYGRTGSLAAPFAPSVWTGGEDLSAAGTILKNFGNPLSANEPDTYLGTNWSTAAPQQSAHNNGIVLCHWFYILTVGKNGTNNAPVPDTYAVTGIGMEKSARILFYAERDYLTSNATYLDMRNATIAVANSLYCGTSPEVVATTNAWYAVNVGEQYVSYPTDVALITPAQAPSVACGAAVSGSLTFVNGGSNTITTVDISYTVDGGTPTTSQWNGTLMACESINYPIAIGTLPRGTHTISYAITTNNDGNSANNSKSSLVLINDAGVVNQVNTFETASDNLISYDEGLTNTLWQRGQAAGTILSNTVAGGSKVYGTNLSGNYPDNKTSYLVSQCYDLTQYQNPKIEFDMAFNLEADYDFINVEYSSNSGSSWTVLGNAGPTWYNSSSMPTDQTCQNCVGAQWTGTSSTNSTKRHYSWNMPEFGNGGTNPQSNIIFRFNFVSDPYEAHEGVIIDNFVITGTTLANSEFNFETFNIVPNPSNGIVNITLSTSSIVNVDLYDIRGRKCFNKSYENSNSIFNQEINLGQLEKGMYLLSVSSEGRTATKKLIIK